MKPEVKIVQFQKFRSGKGQDSEGELIVEKPVDLYVNGMLWITFMCTPTMLKELVVGFLFNEGVIDSAGQVLEYHICDNQEIIDIWLSHPAEKPKEWKRTSGCTGGYTALDLDNLTMQVSEGVAIKAERVRQLVETLFESQDLYKKTGGVHTSILTDGDQVLISAEDVGRHNSLDKIAGMYLLGDKKFDEKILLSTGRISSDMLQKAARIGAALVISRTSPTSMSVELAERWGITLIGYARRDRFNLYTHPNRIIESGPKGVSPQEDQI